MSTMIYKTVLRFPLPYKGSPKEVLDAIREETEGLLEGSETIYWYDEDNDYEACSSWWLDDKLIRLAHWGDEYAIDYIIAKGEDYYDEVISFNKMAEIVDSLCELLNVNKDNVILHSYSWYTGVDEPWRLK